MLFNSVCYLLPKASHLLLIIIVTNKRVLLRARGARCSSVREAGSLAGPSHCSVLEVDTVPVCTTPSKGSRTSPSQLCHRHR